MVIPLIPVLEARLQLSGAQGAALVAAGALSSGLGQPVAAWLSDRFDTRVPGIVGLVLAAVALTRLGSCETYGQLIGVQMVGMLGVGIFHPVAVACVGQLGQRRRARIVSIFFLAGLFGGVLGSTTVPPWVDRSGLRALEWIQIPGLIGVVVLAWAILRMPHRHHGSGDDHARLPREDRRERWWALGVLFAGAMARYVVNMMLAVLVVRWCERLVMRRGGIDALGVNLPDALAHEASRLNGPLQGSMIVGMGVAGLTLGAWTPVRHERLVLTLAPLAGALGVVGFAMLDGNRAGPGAYALGIVMGAGFAGTVPITIAMAQRLLPHRTSLASGVILGGAWAVGAAGPSLAQAILESWGLAVGFGVTAALLAGAGLSSLLLRQGVLLRVGAGQ
ncbi:MAG: MFS transporter [Phycisphaeraceae bacterium]|nr:MFS transporter [Phycisphaeraceae bacterium]